ncbi:MAG: hypothetical protein KKB00_01445 [Gammaproteobacteria bacterium]|nr:hypothetical protein [Gammaproteobacteria bacterium]
MLYELGWFGFSKLGAIVGMGFMSVFIMVVRDKDLVKEIGLKGVLKWFLIFGFIPSLFVIIHLYSKLSYELGFHKILSGNYINREVPNHGRMGGISIDDVSLSYTLNGFTCLSERLSKLEPGDKITVKYIGEESNACILYVFTEKSANRDDLGK